MADSSERFAENVLCILEGTGFKIKKRAEKSDKEAVRGERFVGSTFCTL